MEKAQAENAVVISALITGGMYAYRYFSEGATKSEGKETLQEKGYIEKYIAYYHRNPVLPLHDWIPAFGVTYLSISVITALSPDVGGPLAILAGAGAFLGNITATKNDIKGITSPESKESKPAAKPVGGNNHPPAATAGVSGSTNAMEPA